VTPRSGRSTPLEPHEDAYGQIYLALLEGRPAQEIMERDDGLVYCGDPSDYFAPYRRWPTTEKRAMRFVRGRVLDVGCGAGRVSLHLQERGHEVVAIDESPLAIDVVRRRGVADARVLPLGAVDASLGLFDTIVIMRNNFGLVGKERSARRLLRRLADITTERGRIVTDSVDPERVPDPVFRTYRLRGEGSVRPRAQRNRVRFRTYATPWFYYLMFSPAELEQLVAGSGWRVIRFVDDGSPRFAAVLEKEPAPRARARSAARG
jgi:SAM-dependent methyltransferase